jgi:hypothetical protein
VKGITGESFVAESLILPEGIPPLCDDQGLRTAILDSLPTLDESGVAVRQTSGRDPHRGIQIPGVPAEGSRLADADSRATLATLSPSGKGKGAASSSSAPGCPGRLEGERRHRLCRSDGSFIGDPPLDSGLPQKRQKIAGGVGRPAPRPRARRGASVLHQLHHQSCRHRRHHHLACHRHRGSSINNNSSKGSGRLASKVVGRSRAPSKCIPSHFPHWSSYHVDGY